MQNSKQLKAQFISNDNNNNDNNGDDNNKNSEVY